MRRYRSLIVTLSLVFLFLVYAVASMFLHPS